MRTRDIIFPLQFYPKGGVVEKGVIEKSGVYWLDYRFNGRRLRKKIGPNKKLAETVMRKIRVQIVEGRYLDINDEKKVKFNDFAEVYAENYGKKKRSWVSTDKMYLNRLKDFFGKKYLHEITPFLVHKYRTKRREEKTRRKSKTSVAYVNRELACLKCMFRLAIDWEYAKENPVKKIKFEKENNSRTRFLEKEELKKLLDCCHPLLKAIVLVAVNTGMRKEEIRTLKWRDVDFQRGFVTLYRTKNGEIRNVPLNRTAKEMLMAIPKHVNSPFIFCNSDGNLYNFRASFITALKNAGIKDFRFHDLRHTAASYLAMAGIDLNTIRDILGHKSLGMVLRYAHLSKSHQMNAVSVLDRQMDTFWTKRAKDPRVEEKAEVASYLTSIGFKNFWRGSKVVMPRSANPAGQFYVTH